MPTKKKHVLPPEALEFFRKVGAKGGAVRKRLSFEERRAISLRSAATVRKRRSAAA